MILASVLTSEQIIVNMQATEHWSSICELVDTLVASGKISEAARQPILDALEEREESMSTGIGCGVAIPHITSSHVNEVVAAFGRSSDGIEFNAIDGLPVYLVVLFVVPKDQFQVHLRTLASIAKFFNDRKTREALLAAKTKNQILSILSQRSTGQSAY